MGLTSAGLAWPTTRGILFLRMRDLPHRIRLRYRSFSVLLALIVLATLSLHTVFGTSSQQRPSKDSQNSLFLSEAQCKATFPGLTREIDEAVSRGPFELKKNAESRPSSSVQGRIKAGKLYIVSVNKDVSQDAARYRSAALHQLHRAILTSPEPLPNITFALNINDNPRSNAWSFARRHDPSNERNDWLMPHFSFWSWPQPFIGTFDEVLEEINVLESEIGWEKKIDKAVWRGTVWFNPAGSDLRPKLVQVAGGRDWADVEALRWKNEEEMENGMRIEDFCRYKYIIYTEGVTYSGRLSFHQACTSVILTPPPNYLQHTSHFIRPLFSSTLFGNAAPSTSPTWPRSYSPSEANTIFVEPDWSDLEQTISYLQSHPKMALAVARRQRDTMVEAGYFSPAAEVCYWRALIRGWSQVAMIDEVEVQNGGWGKWAEDSVEEGAGLRWETFSLTEEVTWD